MEINTEQFQEGKDIVREGDIASSFYIIKSVIYFLYREK